MQIKKQANLNDDNAKKCKKGNLIYERNNNVILIYENKYGSKLI